MTCIRGGWGRGHFKRIIQADIYSLEWRCSECHFCHSHKTICSYAAKLFRSYHTRGLIWATFNAKNEVKGFERLERLTVWILTFNEHWCKWSPNASLSLECLGDNIIKKALKTFKDRDIQSLYLDYLYSYQVLICGIYCNCHSEGVNSVRLFYTTKLQHQLKWSCVVLKQVECCVRSTWWELGGDTGHKYTEGCSTWDVWLEERWTFT